MKDRARKAKIRAYMDAHPGTPYVRAAHIVDAAHAEHQAAGSVSEHRDDDFRVWLTGILHLLSLYGEAVETGLLQDGHQVTTRVGYNGDQWWLTVEDIEGVDDLRWTSDTGWTAIIPTPDGLTDSRGRHHLRLHTPDESGRLLLPVSEIIHSLTDLITGERPWPVAAPDLATHRPEPGVLYRDLLDIIEDEQESQVRNLRTVLVDHDGRSTAVRRPQRR